MKIDLTPAQVTELTNPFWDIPLDDGQGNSLGLYSDDLIRELPLNEVIVGILGQDEDGTAYACEHPDLTPEDETLIKYALDWRAEQMATIAALPTADRPAARTALRSSIRVAARQEARRAERVAARIQARTAERIEDRRAAATLARQLWRAQVRAEAVAAGKLPA